MWVCAKVTRPPLLLREALEGHFHQPASETWDTGLGETHGPPGRHGARGLLTVGSILLMASCSICTSFTSKHFWSSWGYRGAGVRGWVPVALGVPLRVLLLPAWAGEPHLREGLVDLDGVQAAGAEPLLALLLLVLLHGLLDAQLGTAPHTLLEGFQLVVEALHVLAIGCLWGLGSAHWTWPNAQEGLGGPGPSRRSSSEAPHSSPSLFLTYMKGSPRPGLPRQGPHLAFAKDHLLGSPALLQI